MSTVCGSRARSGGAYAVPGPERKNKSCSTMHCGPVVGEGCGGGSVTATPWTVGEGSAAGGRSVDSGLGSAGRGLVGGEGAWFSGVLGALEEVLTEMLQASRAKKTTKAQINKRYDSLLLIACLLNERSAPAHTSDWVDRLRSQHSL